MRKAEGANCTEPTAMLAFLGTTGRANNRKLSVFGVACCCHVLCLEVRGLG
jgi:hypothetical protein